jgi:hypothetical protein
VRWLRVGNMLLHLFQSGDPAPQGHHFGIKVNECEDACIRSKGRELGVQIEYRYFSNVYELRDGISPDLRT